MNKPFLIYISTRTNFPLLKYISEKLSEKGESVIFCCEGSDTTLNEMVGDISKKNNLVLFNDFVKECEKNHTQKFKWRYRNSNAMLAHSNYHYIRKRAAKRLLATVKPAIIINSEDGISGNFWLLGVAKRKKIPIILCPFAIGSQKDLEHELSHKEANNTLKVCNDDEYGKLLKRKYPQWIKSGNFSGALMYPTEYILALEKNGITIPNPWTIQGGVSNYIAVESPHMHQHYIDEGINPSKLKLTGTVYCDMMHETLSSSVQLENAFNTAKPIEKNKRSLLVSWPPSYHATRGEHCEFQDYHDMTEQIMKYLHSIENLDLTISLHPAADTEIVNRLEKLGIKISNDYIINLIPQHDLYLTYYSSTLRWASACRKPAINYDLYGLKLNNYGEEPGVKTVSSFAEFKIILKKYFEDDYYTHCSSSLKQISEHWGVVDGNSFNHTYALMKKLV